MIYRFSIVTPANTPRTSPQKTVLKLDRGLIYRIQFRFPPGPAALLHIYIRRGLRQIWPINPEEAFATDDELIDFEEYYPLTERPYQLEAYTWNEDDTYDHEVIVRIGLERRKFLVRKWF